MANRPVMTPAQAEYQARKNEDDVHVSVNQRLGSLELALASLTKAVNDASAKQGTDKVSLEVLISNILETTNETLKKFGARLDQLERLCKEKLDMQDYRVQKMQESVAYKEDLNQELTLLHASVRKTDKSLEDFKNSFAGSLQHLHNQLESKVSAQEKRLLSKPDCVLEAKKELRETDDVLRGDLNAANEHLKKLFQQMELIQKKFEYVTYVLTKNKLQ